jgi:hypothetical protein
MIQSMKVCAAIALGLFCCSVASAQEQEPPRFSRDYCVKVKDGKGQEYAAFLQDVTVKLAKLRVESGAPDSFVIARAVAPAGRSAHCDYHIVSSYTGFPPELPTREQNAADLKKAGVSMSWDAMVAKRTELAYLVGMDVWRWRERVGPTVKGGYARINYDKVHPGMAGQWQYMESTGWKQLAEAAVKEHGTSWRAASLVMPAGADLPYNAMTIDIFPSWAAMGQGIPARDLWNKVHPDTDMSAHLNGLAAIRDRPRVDVVKLIEVIEK